MTNETQVRSYPRWLTTAVVVGCGLPALLMILGLDLGTPGSDAASAKGLADLHGQLHRQLAGSFMHTILEWSAVGAALATGLGTVIHYQVRRNAVITVIGLTILASGVMDGFHVLVADRLIASQAGDPDFVPFTGFISRLFCAASLILGSVLLLTRTGRARETRAQVVATASLVMSAAVALSVAFASTTPFVPQPLFPGAIVPRPFDLIPLALFLVAGAFAFPMLNRFHPSVFTQALIISVVPHASSQLYMALGSTVAFDGWYNAAHVVKVLAYLVPGSGLLVEYVRIHREEAAIMAELQENKRTLRRHREMYHTMVKNLPNSIVFLFDRDMGSLAAEGTALQWLERSSSDFEGEVLSDVLPRSAWTDLEAPFRKSLEGETSSFVYRISGRIFDVKVVPLREVDLSITAGMAVLVDITERRDDERSLRLTQFSVDRAADAVMWLNEEGRLLYANEAVSKYLGYSIDELLALSFVDIDPYLTEVRWPELWTEVKRVKSRTIQGQFRKRDSKVIPVESTLSYLEYEEREYICVLSRDITERVRQVTLVAEKEAAEVANLAKSQFLAQMSHELRTPLNSVIGFANILLKNKGENLLAKDLKYLTRILDNGRHLLALINDALDLSKVEAGKMSLIIEEVDVVDLVNEVIEQLVVQVDGKPVELLTEITQPVPRIETDPARLRQVLINLVGNAIKFTQEGAVTLRVGPVPGERAKIYIEVSDTGIGIDATKLESIFEPFQQADASTSRRYGGTGLGLSISLAVLELLGHRLDVNSTVGQGSTFRIVCRRVHRQKPTEPAAQTPPMGHLVPESTITGSEGPTTREIRPLQGPDKEKALILVIDDDSDARTLLAHTIEECGCRVVTASSGRSGLRMARTLQPDLIVLDLMMPEMNGQEVLAKLKETPQLGEIPVVVVSFVASESRKYLKGVHAVINKPASREDLSSAIFRSLGSDRKRILIVDDDEMVRQFLASLLTKAGVQVRTAANGEAGLRVLSHYPADLVVVDLGMPLMDGFGFIGALRGDAQHVELPVVVVTGRDLNQSEEDFLQQEAYAILHKGTEVTQRLPSVVTSVPRRDGSIDPTPEQVAKTIQTDVQETLETLQMDVEELIETVQMDPQEVNETIQTDSQD